jgi:hypothetical protein
MTNKVSLKKDILTSGILSNLFKSEEYPIDLIDINFELMRNTSSLQRIGKTEINQIFNTIIPTVRSITQKKKIGFGTISIEVETGFSPGEHIILFRFVIVGFELKSMEDELKKKLENKLMGTLNIKYSKQNKIGLQLELIPLQLDLYSFNEAIKKNREDKVFYSDDILEFVLNGFRIMSDEDLKDPLYVFYTHHY